MNSQRFNPMKVGNLLQKFSLLVHGIHFYSEPDKGPPSEVNPMS